MDGEYFFVRSSDMGLAFGLCTRDRLLTGDDLELKICRCLGSIALGGGDHRFRLRSGVLLQVLSLGLCGLEALSAGALGVALEFLCFTNRARSQLVDLLPGRFRCLAHRHLNGHSQVLSLRYERICPGTHLIGFVKSGRSQLVDLGRGRLALALDLEGHCLSQRIDLGRGLRLQLLSRLFGRELDLVGFTSDSFCLGLGVDTSGIRVVNQPLCGVLGLAPALFRLSAGLFKGRFGFTLLAIRLVTEFLCFLPQGLRTILCRLERLRSVLLRLCRHRFEVLEFSLAQHDLCQTRLSGFLCLVEQAQGLLFDILSIRFRLIAVFSSFCCERIRRYNRSSLR